MRDFSLGIDANPEYLFDPEQTDESAVAAWWFERWGRRRAEQAAVLESVRLHSLVRPMHHGARVPLPPLEEADGDAETSRLFADDFYAEM